MDGKKKILLATKIEVFFFFWKQQNRNDGSDRSKQEKL